MGADVLLAKKITYGLGGVVPLMQYISGRKYEQLAEQCGEEDEQGVVPLRLLRNRDMMAAISAVCRIIRIYCFAPTRATSTRWTRATSSTPPAASRCSSRPSRSRRRPQGRRDGVPARGARLQPAGRGGAEHRHDRRQLRQPDRGRTEQIIGYTFRILKKLVLDDGDEGVHFRRFHAATIHMALDIIVRNSGRDTRENRQESEEKTVLDGVRRLPARGLLRVARGDRADADAQRRRGDDGLHEERGALRPRGHARVGRAHRRRLVGAGAAAVPAAAQDRRPHRGPSDDPDGRGAGGAAHGRGDPRPTCRARLRRVGRDGRAAEAAHRAALLRAGRRAGRAAALPDDPHPDLADRLCARAARARASCTGRARSSARRTCR